MKLVYKGSSDCRVGDRLFTAGDVGDFDETTSSGLVQDSSWEPVEAKPAKRVKKTKTEDSQDETGAE
ncbi:MAG: hypothetical protein CL524_04855 [Aequorivita sp.]|nr:hypothetical protein [Aequorivita sp.]